MRKPTHPGKILESHYMEPLNLDIKWLSDDLGIHQQALSDIINETKPITNEIAEKLAKSFNTTPEMWTNLQKNYDYGRS